MDSELEVLRRAYPLPSCWERVDLFSERVAVEGLTIHCVGLLAVSGDGREVTGSAACTHSSPVARAYFELVERATLVDLQSNPRDSYPLLNSDARYAGIIAHDELFPSAPEGSPFRFALSNGVAVGPDFEHAARGAHAELVERDRLLRSWFGRGAPVPLAAIGHDSSSIPHHLYDVEVYDFPAHQPEDDSSLEVIGVFAFPKRAHAPLVYGSAAAPTREQAVRHASRECLQRLGFLWGEALPNSLPEFEPTPGYHQEFYLYPESHGALRAWLSGANEENRPMSRLRSRRGRRFAILTPEHLLRRLCVVKVLPDEDLRLAFGQHPDVKSELRQRGVHPIA